MELIKIRKNFQVTIPQNLRRLIKLAEGDLVEAEVKDGALVIRPVHVVPAGQEYFHTKEWQAKEAEADAAIAASRLLGPVGSMDEAKELFDKGIKSAREPDGFDRSAGAWQGLIDPDELIADIYARRAASSRPKVEL